MENLTEKDVQKLADAALAMLDKEPEERESAEVRIGDQVFTVEPKRADRVEAVDPEQAQEKDREASFPAIHPQPKQPDKVQSFSFARALSACWRRNWKGAEFEREVLIQTKALTTDDDSAGGFLVQDELLPELIPELYAQTVVRSLGATIYTMSSEKLSIPRMASGATAYWLDQSTQKTESQPAFEQVTLNLRECIGLVPIHERLLKFANQSIETIVRQDLMKQLALAEDQAFIRGTGGVQPLGLYYQAGVGSANIDTNGAVPTASDLTGMMYQIELLNGSYSGWAMHPRSLNTIRSLVDGNNRPIYYDSMASGIPNGLFGMPVKTTTQIPINLTVGTSSDCSYIILGNWPSYAIGEAGAIEIAVSRDEKFSYDQVLIRAVHYVDGVPKQPEEFYILKGIRA